MMLDRDARALAEEVLCTCSRQSGNQHAVWCSADRLGLIDRVTTALVAFAGEERALPDVSVESLKTIEARLLSANARLRGDHPHPWSALALVAWNTVIAEIERVRALRSDAP